MANSTYQQIRARLEAEYPDLWRAFNPRIYTGVDGWGSSAVLAAHMAATCAGYASGLTDDFTRITVLTAGRLLEHSVPLFWVKPDLLAAVAQTEPPPELLWTEMHFPFPAGAFMLPSGSVRDAAGNSYDYATWCVVKNRVPVSIPLSEPLSVTHDSLTFTSASASDPQFGGLTRSVSANQWAWAQLPTASEGDIISNLNASQSETVNRLAKLALGLLLAMDARPQLLTEGAPRLRSPKPGKREIWTPNILGASYRTPSGIAGEGSHASPRLHWRRGHFRRQAHGVGRLERRTIWIEPTLIGKE